MKKEPQSIFPEKQSGLEKKKPCLATVNQAADYDAAQTVSDYFDEEQEWSSEAYNEEFYSPLDPEKIEFIFTQLKTLEREEGDQMVIDLRRLFSQEGMTSTELTKLENYAIFYFMFRKVIPEILKIRPEDHLSVLDIGSGPTVYQFILMSMLAGQIQPAEYDSDNRAELDRWLAEGQGNWETFFSCFSRLVPELSSVISDPDLANRAKMIESDPSYIDKYLREITRKPVPVDVFEEGMLLDRIDFEHDAINIGREGSASLLTSFFCVESAFTSDKARWQKGTKNLCKKLNRGGFLIMAAITGADWYRDGEHKIPAVNVNSGDITAELRSNGLEVISTTGLICETEQEAMSAGRVDTYSGYSGMSLILARKIN